ncbi:MAG: methyltransferase, partial [Verrucomicrobia bacterium]|nr:methyltransferase [Verrucomicrobiota bacterium]
RVRKTMVDPARPFLRELGVTDARGNVLPRMQGKWNQINKFIEIIARLISEARLDQRQSLQVVDMGCGKGYLTFALHDYIQGTMGKTPEIRGIERREDLVRATNGIVATLGLTGLNFDAGGIAETELTRVDLMIALHACDTGTDDAIAKGIQANAQVIVCAPCCHKELRPQIKPPMVLAGVLRHGILLERQAEILTDGLRAMLLEQAGYRADVFEFVSPEHTGRNVIITGVRRDPEAAQKAPDAGIQGLKDFFGVATQSLETALNRSRARKETSGS